MIKLKYRTGLKDMPSYDVVERDWDIKVNANESNMNLPPIIEDRLMARLASVAFNRYPNEQVELLAEQIADNFRLDKENILIANGSSEILEKLFLLLAVEVENSISTTIFFQCINLCQI